MLINNTFLLRRERSFPDTSAVGLDDSDDGFDFLRRNSESSADAADVCGAGRDVGVSAEVEVEHARVGAFSEDLFALSDVLVHEADSVDDHFLGHGAVPVLLQDFQFFCCIHFQVVFLLKHFLDVVVLGHEFIPDFQVAHAQPESACFRLVGWADSLLGGANLLFCILFIFSR